MSTLAWTWWRLPSFPNVSSPCLPSPFLTGGGLAEAASQPTEQAPNGTVPRL
jgi:hypothetical protein